MWLDREAGLLMLDTGAQGRADEITSLLVEQLPGLSLALLDTQTSPQAAMAHWLKSQEPPAGFSIDRECELKSAGEDKAVALRAPPAGHRGGAGAYRGRQAAHQTGHELGRPRQLCAHRGPGS